MKMMKCLGTVLLVICLIFALTACKSNNVVVDDESDADTSFVETPVTSDVSDNENADDPSDEVQPTDPQNDADVTQAPAAAQATVKATAGQTTVKAAPGQTTAKGSTAKAATTKKRVTARPRRTTPVPTTTITKTPAITAAPTTTAKYIKPMKIICVGDSITQGHNDTKNTYWTNNFQGYLDSKHTVVGYGLNGTFVQHTASQPYVNYQPYQASLLSKPDIVIIILGTNDSMTNAWTSASPETFVNDYVKLVKTYQNLPTSPTVILGLPPYALPGCKYSIRNNIIEGEIIPAIYRVAEKTGVQVIDTHTPTVNAPASWYMEDGVHPLDGARKAIAKAITDALKPITG